jgi:hypothetical protein
MYEKGKCGTYIHVRSEGARCCREMLVGPARAVSCAGGLGSALIAAMPLAGGHYRPAVDVKAADRVLRWLISGYVS